MLGLILALHSILVAEQSALNVGTEPWALEAPALRNVGLSLAATHDWSLSRIKSATRNASEIRDGRRDSAVGIRRCADAHRVLTAYGPVIAAEAPEILEAAKETVHRETQSGYTGDGGAVPALSLPTGCIVPTEHVWLATQLH